MNTFNWSSLLEGIIAAVLTVIFSSIVIYRKNKKASEFKEAERNQKLDDLIQKVEKLSVDICNHEHKDYDKKFEAIDKRCGIREVKVDDVLKGISKEMSTNMDSFRELKLAIQPLHKMETDLAVVCEKMTSIDKLLNEKLKNVSDNQIDLEERVKQIENKK